MGVAAGPLGPAARREGTPGPGRPTDQGVRLASVRVARLRQPAGRPKRGPRSPTDRRQLPGNRVSMARLMAVPSINTLTEVPTTFRWLGTPADASLGAGALSISAGPGEDWFIDPGSGATTLNAPALVGSLTGNFTLSAHVDAGFKSTFDAGALVVWHDDRTWAKLAYEFSPAGDPMVVSVVTRGESDDCNSTVVSKGGVWLRMAYIDGAYAFHSSANGRDWQFVRHFRLSSEGAGEVGFEAQSPLGEGCRARFSEIVHAERTLTDLRNGE